MKLGIYTNTNKDANLSITHQVIDILLDAKFDCCVFENISNQFANLTAFNIQNLAANVDMLITIGGDGTILGIAQYSAINNVPILGINLGTVGFLTEIELSEVANIASIIKSKSYSLERRSMIEVSVGNALPQIALNEIAITRHSKLLNIDVYIANQKVDTYHSDGFIVSTPTGSTAYSLSCGGSIISPTTAALALTPINSHSLHSRPLVINDSETVQIRITNNVVADIVIDGVKISEILPNQIITIRKSQHSASFVRRNASNFYSKLLTKLNKWSVVSTD